MSCYPSVASKVVVLLILAAAHLTSTARAQVSVTTYHNDLARTGQNLSETNLTPANVKSSSFGKLFTQPVDGYVYGQPLYLPAVTIPGKGVHNVVFVVTEHDSIYAFDADSNQGSNSAPLWQVSFINPAAGVTTVPNSDIGSTDIVPEIGITATPVIDPATGTIYIVAKTKETIGPSLNYVHRLHALDVTTGLEQSNSPVVIQATVPGNANSGTTVTFNSLRQLGRPGLALFNGIVYLSFGSHGDNGTYQGWVLGYDSQTLQRLRVFNTAPNGQGNAIWQSGCAPAIDTNGYLYFMTGNGSFAPAQGNYGDSVLKLDTNISLISVADYFTPYNQSALNSGDVDLGSGGAVLMPDEAGSLAHPHLLVGCGKQGTIYLIDRDNMGHFNSANNNQIVQSVVGANSGTWSSPAYFNGMLFYGGSGNPVQAFRISNGQLGTAALSSSSFSMSFPGATPSISANGINNAILWCVQSDGFGSRSPGILHALNPNNLAQEYYNSGQAGSRDNPGPAVKFIVPTVANGKVYVGAAYAFSVFGNGTFLSAPVISPNGANFTNTLQVTVSISAGDISLGAEIHYTLDSSTPTISSLLYTGPLTLTNTTVLRAEAFATNAVPSAVASAAFFTGSSIGTGTGLRGTYYANQLKTFNNPPTLVRIDPVINFNWNSSSPAPSIGLTDYTVKWTGSVKAQFTEPYTFVTIADDGVRLFIGGQELINEWIDQAPTQWSGTMNLVAGQTYALEMDYYQNQGGAVASLSWSSPSTPLQIIPATQLYLPLDVPPSVSLTNPSSGGSAVAPTNILLQATASSSGGLVANVKFFANTNLIGTQAKSPYQIIWPNPAPGQYQLYAVATDTIGGTNVSSNIAFTVFPPELSAATIVGGLQLSWASVQGSLVLESTPDLTPPAVWTAQNVGFSQNGSQTSATLTNLPNSTLYFRLRTQ